MTPLVPIMLSLLTAGAAELFLISRWAYAGPFPKVMPQGIRRSNSYDRCNLIDAMTFRDQERLGRLNSLTDEPFARRNPGRLSKAADERPQAHTAF